MSVTLVSYPVIISSGKTRNIFAGFAPVEITMQRSDASIVSVSLGASSRALISISGNITSVLSIGEWVYLYASGINYTYDGTFKILDLSFSSPNTLITIDAFYIVGAYSGYCNYKQNWFLESKIVSPINSDIMVYPQLLQNDGNPNGIIDINVSMLVDFLQNEIKITSQEIIRSRAKCKVMYREVWRENSTENFILIDQIPIIIIFAAENYEIESIVNNFEIPKIFDGYPFWLNLLHSTENYTGIRLNATFNENDINKNTINSANPLYLFNTDNYGILQINFNNKQKVIEQNTRYITININSSGIADFATGDFNDNDFQTINTP